ncbi:MAG TPA: sigma-70 family RNA polymerase sigma factor [Pyrinomonadaceae bacterium]|nr:sigma-70 family RNA polymerase sigma factor [Pyrinomonadaceae bacterium]
MERSDAELIEGCRRGEEAAWEALVARYQRLIYAIPRRAGLDEDRAAEVFQDVFATLLESLSNISQPERLQAWLVTTAKRKSWRLIRRESSTRSFSTDDETQETEMSNLADSALLPDEAMRQLEEQHLVRLSLAELDERCRTLLTILFYSTDPVPYSEIAARLGTSEGSIGPTRARCLRKLQTVLQQKGL